MNTIKRKDITFTQKLIYAVVAVKQGESSHAKLTNKQIAEAVNCSTRYVSESISQMGTLLQRISKGKVSANKVKGQYGMVELDMLITTNISQRAKFLYLIYCVTGNEYDANIWGRKSICEKFHISNSTYYKAHKELLDKRILQTKARSSGSGIQTSNINIIIRTENWEIIRPSSWTPPEPFDLDKWCLENIDVEQGIQPEQAFSKTDNGTEDTTHDEERVQRTLTINSNLNNDPISSNLKQTNGSFSTSSFEHPENQLNTEILEDAFRKKFKTPEEVVDAISILNDNGFEGVTKDSLTYDVIEKAFKVFEYFKVAVENYGQNTLGYYLNLEDLNRFCNSGLRTGYSCESIEYHINRVVQLGYETLNKPYVGFKYVINTDRGVHQEFKT